MSTRRRTPNPSSTTTSVELSSAIEARADADDRLIKAMIAGYRSGTGANEIARRVKDFWSRAITLEILAISDRQERIRQLLTSAGVTVNGTDDDGGIQVKLWVHHRFFRGVICSHLPSYHSDEPAQRTAEVVIPLLYQAGYRAHWALSVDGIYNPVKAGDGYDQAAAMAAFSHRYEDLVITEPAAPVGR
ncbi:hypothetical protein AB0C34_17145 [Nocardia sp. NPDC049220]|uniref:hypothetical protein n=1 Tax=Nocardia sp. NPDC049220 TaxID=3155273 RepID=UPI0033CA6DFE